MIGEDVELIPPADQACRLCGARRRRGEPDELWLVDLLPRFERRSEVRVRRDADGVERLEADERPWSRRHVACEPTAAYVVGAVTGIALPDDLAREVLRRHGVGLLAGDRQAAARRPWEHLLPEEKVKVTALAKALQEPPEPRLHDAGRCGCCGRSRSVVWSRLVGLSWHEDGLPAAMCDTCTTVSPVGGDLDLLRLRAIGLLAGVRPTPSLRQHDYYGFRFACEVLQGEERRVDGADAWQYRRPALERVQEAVRQSLPELLLDEHDRDEGVRVLRAKRASAAADAARREAASRVGATDW